MDELEVILAINREKKLIRLVDSVGAVHSYYAPKGTTYDLNKLEDLMTRAVGIRLDVAVPERRRKPARKRAA